MVPYKVHRVNFYDLEATSVNSVAVNNDAKKLALSRSDARLEIWNLEHHPFLERSVASSTDNFSIESLAWCGFRLFSVGLHGMLVEYDLCKLCVKNQLVVTGGAAFCLDIRGNEIAIGTEQGYVNIFEIHENTEVYYKKFLDKQDGRILCLKYADEVTIVSGGEDAIRIWNTTTGHCLHKMTLGRAESSKPTIVWCLEVTQDFTIITGDSRGKLTFWDGKTASQIASHQSHKADVFALCLSDDGSELYCAGTDPAVTSYVRISFNMKWVRSIRKRTHDHDVRALAFFGDKLFSSGIDGYLVCCYNKPKTVLKFPPVMQNPCVQVCSEASMILLRYPRHLEVWSLNDARKLLVRLERSVRGAGGQCSSEGIICAAMSDSGEHLVYATARGVKFYEFVYKEGEASVAAVTNGDKWEPNSAGDKWVCNSAISLSNGRFLLIPRSGAYLRIATLREGDVNFEDVPVQENEITFPVLHSAATSCGKYFCLADSQSNVAIWSIKKNRCVFECKAPKYRATPTCLAINSKTHHIVVAYNDAQIIEFDVVKRELIHSTKGPLHSIRTISFDLDSNVFLHDDERVAVINGSRNEKKKQTKKLKLENETKEVAVHADITRYKHLVHFECIANKNEIVAVEIPPLDFIKGLPPCLLQSTFGRK